MSPEPRPPWLPTTAAAEGLAVWAACFLAILIAYPVSPSLAGLVATAGFLYGPQVAMRTRGEDLEHAGLTLFAWRRDLRFFALTSAAIFPLFVVGYVAFTWAYPLLPEEMLRVLTPYVAAPRFSFRLPDHFVENVVQHVFVVALPEEFFYRGYLQARLRDAWPDGAVLWGARLGRAFWLTALLFAVGHLAVFQAWRLAVFFPALVFGWLKEKTGSIWAGALFHASSNVLLQVLDASFFG